MAPVASVDPIESDSDARTEVVDPAGQSGIEVIEQQAVTKLALT